MSPLQYRVYEYIRNYLLEHGYSPSLLEIAKGIGISPKSKGLISRYVHILIKAGWLRMDHKGYRSINLPLTQFQLPIVGRIAAGSPIEPVEQQEILDLAAELCEAGCYVLEVKGDSMIGEGILDGDNIICKRQAVAKEGDIVVALIDEEKATLKRIHYQSDGKIELVPANPAFHPQSYAKDRITIQGIFVGLVRLPAKRLKTEADQANTENLHKTVNSSFIATPVITENEE